MVKYLKKATPQLVDGFHTEKQKNCYLKNTLLRKQYIEIPVKNMPSKNIEYGQFVIALNKSIQLQGEIDRASGSQKYFRHFVTHPKDGGMLDSPHDIEYRFLNEYDGYRFRSSRSYENDYVNDLHRSHSRPSKY